MILKPAGFRMSSTIISLNDAAQSRALGNATVRPFRCLIVVQPGLTIPLTAARKALSLLSVAWTIWIKLGLLGMVPNWIQGSALVPAAFGRKRGRGCKCTVALARVNVSSTSFNVDRAPTAPKKEPTIPKGRYPAETLGLSRAP